MSDARPVLPPRLLRTDEAARWLGLSGRTLEKHRFTGTGPSYRKLGRGWFTGSTKASGGRPTIAAFRRRTGRGVRQRGRRPRADLPGNAVSP